MKWCFLGVHDGEIDPIFILFSSENWFQLSGYIDPCKQGVSILIHEVPLHEMTVGV